MELGLVGGLAAVVLLGVLGQVIGRALAIPAIIVLLALGLLAGPVTGLLNPDAIFGDALIPLVSMGVGLLLFEESLKLDFTRLAGGGRRPVMALVTVGVVLTGVGAAAATYLVFGLPWSRAAVIGAILIVSGPTVVGPLLQLIRPKQPLESILAFEGIFIDPIGATVALMVANYALHETGESLVPTALSGVAVGLGIAVLVVVPLRRGWVPPTTEVALAVGLALGAYATAEALTEEAGLFATTTMGLVLANQRLVRIDPLHEFGSHVGLMLVGALFIVLSARVDLGALADYAPRTLLLVAILVLVQRPVVAWVCTSRSVLGLRERAMVAWMAPRGVVAASTASVFSLRFDDAGVPFPQIVPVVFGVIIATAVLYGLSGPAVAQRLGVRSEEPEKLDADGIPVA